MFGLLGDMVKCMGDLLKPHLPIFIHVAQDHLEYNDQMPTTLTVCNNACWFIGQVAASNGGINNGALLPFIEPIANKI